MKYAAIPGIEKKISRIAQGAMMIVSDNQDDMFAKFDAIYDMGCTLFDTAHGYGGGTVDRGLGAWINVRGVRDEVVILGKGAHPYNGVERVTPEHITSDLHESMERMQVDHIDLYILHRDNPKLPVGPIVEILNEHKNAGKISAFGGSNWTHQRLQEANDYAAAHGLTPFVASSVQFSLAEMVKEPWPNCISIGGPANEAARAWYQETDMAIIPWSSLAGGFFSGRFMRDNLDSFEDYFDKVCINAYCYEDNFKRLDRVKEMAAQKNLSLAQVAMAYVFNQPLNIYGLVGCRTAEEFQQNVEALEVTFTPEEVAWLDLR